MKLPKTVTIYGKTYTIIKDPKERGGYFDCDKNEITIGTSLKTEIPRTFLHEIIETIMTENFHRYKRPYINADNGDLIFIFDHAEWANMVPQIALALKDIIKE